MDSKLIPSLVKELSNGSYDAFNSLFRFYSKGLYHFALGYLKSQHESEELVQEVFTIIWERREQLKDDLSFKAFLFTIAYNIIKKHFRRKSIELEYFRNEIFQDKHQDTSEIVVYNSLSELLKSLVDRLPPRQREVFMSSRFEGKTIREISEELNISHKTVENHLTGALKFIRENLNNEGVAGMLFFILFLSL